MQIGFFLFSYSDLFCIKVLPYSIWRIRRSMFCSFGRVFHPPYSQWIVLPLKFWCRKGKCSLILAKPSPSNRNFFQSNWLSGFLFEFFLFVYTAQSVVSRKYDLSHWLGTSLPILDHGAGMVSYFSAIIFNIYKL